MERVVFVCDNFADGFTGGAELSLQTHIDSCPYPKTLVRSAEFNPKRFDPKKDFLIFGNFAHLKRDVLPVIQENFRYVVEECDYKYCSFRSSHKHEAMVKQPCDCHKMKHGVEVFAFMASAEWVFWKSERQRAEYQRLFGFDEGATMMGSIVSGVFSDADIDFMLELRRRREVGACDHGTGLCDHNPDEEDSKIVQEDKYFVLYSGSWIKGYNNAAEYCRENGLKMKVVGNIPYRNCLEAMAACKGIVYIPNGFDVSCRMITEAKVLGLDIRTTKLVQHVDEYWFKGPLNDMIQFLRTRNREFWGIVDCLYKKERTA